MVISNNFGKNLCINLNVVYGKKLACEAGIVSAAFEVMLKRNIC